MDIYINDFYFKMLKKKIFFFKEQQKQQLNNELKQILTEDDQENNVKFNIKSENYNEFEIDNIDKFITSDYKEVKQDTLKICNYKR